MTVTRIATSRGQMGGAPRMRGSRMPAATAVDMVADEMTETEILEAFPNQERQDIHEALRYAAQAVRARRLPLVMPVRSS